VLLFVFFAGFAAVLQVSGLEGADADLSLLRVSKLAFSPWMVGVIGAAGVLTALVPGSMLLLTASTILAQNVYREIVPGADDRMVAFVARALVPGIALVAIFLTLRGGSELVPLLLMGYNLVTQLFPALILSLGSRQLASSAGAFTGILAGELTVAYVTISGATLATLLPAAPQVVKDLNVGLVALLVNIVVMLAVSVMTRRPVAEPVWRSAEG
jgi:SSS family solute:Na+ symporter